jgi:hypothetical protein
MTILWEDEIVPFQEGSAEPQVPRFCGPFLDMFFFFLAAHQLSLAFAEDQAGG